MTDLGPLSNPTQQNMEVLMAVQADLVFYNKIVESRTMNIT